MPEEIGIALIIIVFIGWFLIKLFQALGRAFDQTLKTTSDTLTAHSRASFQNKKQKLSRYVTVSVPNQLDSAEQAIDALQSNLQQTKDRTEWKVQRPPWIRKAFTSLTLPTQHENYEQMNVEDVRTILQGGSQRWTDEETKLLSLSCNYPHSQPQMPSLEFTPIEPLSLSLDEARFEYAQSKLSEGKIKKYFDVERRSVIAYNERRSSIIAGLERLNSEVHTRNNQSKTAWESCVRETEKLFNAERRDYLQTCDLYISNCEDQKRVLSEMLAGYENGIKSDVINRVHCVLSTLVLPVQFHAHGKLTSTKKREFS